MTMVARIAGATASATLSEKASAYVLGSTAAKMTMSKVMIPVA